MNTEFGKTRDERAANPAWKKRLGDAVRSVRVLREMTQGRLAKEVGVDITSISAIERGQAVPNLAMLDAIADVLEAPLDLLAGRMSLRAAEITNMINLGDHYEKPFFPDDGDFDEDDSDSSQRLGAPRPPEERRDPDAVDREIIRQAKRLDALAGVLSDLLLQLSKTANLPESLRSSIEPLRRTLDGARPPTSEN